MEVTDDLTTWHQGAGQPKGTVGLWQDFDFYVQTNYIASASNLTDKNISLIKCVQEANRDDKTEGQ